MVDSGRVVTERDCRRSWRLSLLESKVLPSTRELAENATDHRVGNKARERLVAQEAEANSLRRKLGITTS
jgi:hypothetical protein